MPTGTLANNLALELLSDRNRRRVACGAGAYVRIRYNTDRALSLYSRNIDPRVFHGNGK